MPRHRFAQVDVFTDVPLRGNPVAVVFEADGLSTAQMQAFCDWTNLSEATFLLAPTDPAADYAVRIFSPGRELPFAGHPTLGTCHAWLSAGGQKRNADRVIQQCGAGLVEIRHGRDTLAFAAPPLHRNDPLPAGELDRVVAALRLDPGDVVEHRWCDNGPQWRGILLASAEQVLAVRPRPELMDGLDVGIAGPHPAGGPADLEVRAFFTGNGGALAEDPVTGSLNAALGQWLIPAGRLPRRYVARQGTVLGRDGRVSVEFDGAATWVGGRSVTVLSGEARF